MRHYTLPFHRGREHVRASLGWKCSKGYEKNEPIIEECIYIQAWGSGIILEKCPHARAGDLVAKHTRVHALIWLPASRVWGKR
jgi:hypothetical protein